LDEVDDTSILKTGRPARYRRSLPQDSARDRARRAAGYRASDLVLWPRAVVAAIRPQRQLSGDKLPFIDWSRASVGNQPAVTRCIVCVAKLIPENQEDHADHQRRHGNRRVQQETSS